MTTQHTPGPWHYEPPGPRYPENGAGHQVWPADPGRGRICTVTDRYPRGEDQANARLIAAAPDLRDSHANLLTKLQLVLDHVDYTDGACGPNEMVAAVLPRNILKFVHAAIVKAKKIDL